ncbi:MAG TPA: LptF/LptG family permease [Chthoniobacterales bacterium]|jgi:lipopolysaccharide export system permease protein
MNIIDRYVSRQLLVNLFFAIVVLSFVLIVGNIFRKLLPLLVNHEVPVEYVIGFVAYVLPFSLIFTIPWGLLTAVLLVFGRLSADNELTALRSNGVSITRICIPLVGIAIACTAISLWLNLAVAPAAQEEMRSTVFNLATHNPMALFGSDQVIDQFPNHKIYVGKKDGNTLENILVWELNENSMPMRVTHARSGMLEADLENKRVLMHLYGARYMERYEPNPYDLDRTRDGVTVAEGTLPIGLEELYEKEKRRPGRSMLSLEQLMDQLKDTDPKLRSSGRTEINKRFSFPLACVVFAFIGVPLGITAHRRETSFGFAVSMVIGVFYFLFIIVADTLRANAKLHPELLVWFPNALFLVLGYWMFRRLSKQ